MTISKSQKINLGIFITVSSGLVIAGIVFLVGLSLLKTKDHYLIRFSAKNISMSGLDVGSAVKYSGIQIGRVSSIRIDPDDVSIIIVTLEIDHGTPVAEDSVASLGSVGITGLKYVELSRGSPSVRVRQPGEEIPSSPSFIDEITGKASIIANKTELLLNKLNAFLTDERQQYFWDTVGQLKQLAASSDLTLNEVRPALLELNKKSTAVAAEIETIVHSFHQLMSEISPSFKNIVLSSEQLVKNMETTRTRLNNLLSDTQKVMEALNDNLGETGLKTSVSKLNTLLDQSTLLMKQGEEDILFTLEHLRETAENLDDFSVMIRENPSLLLRTQETEEIDVK